MNRALAQRITLIFGIVYLLIGIMGFIPAFTTPDTSSMSMSSMPGDSLFLGLFAVNVIHNIAHIIFGAALIFAGLNGQYTHIVNWVLAVVFVVLIVASFILPMSQSMALNWPDNFLHLFSALLTGYLGYAAYQHINSTDTPARI